MEFVKIMMASQHHQVVDCKEEKIESQLSQKSNYKTCRRPTNLQSQEKKLFFSFWYSRVKEDDFDIENIFNHIKNLEMFSRIVATSENP